MDINTVVEVRQKLLDLEIDVFKPTDIPFDVDDINVMDDVYCIDSRTGEVYLLWVLIYDTMNPLEWQTDRILRHPTFNDFLNTQTKLYR